MTVAVQQPERARSLLQYLDDSKEDVESEYDPIEEDFVPYSQRPETSALIQDLKKMGVALIDDDA